MGQETETLNGMNVTELRDYARMVDDDSSVAERNPDWYRYQKFQRGF